MRVREKGAARESRSDRIAAGGDLNTPRLRFLRRGQDNVARTGFQRGDTIVRLKEFFQFRPKPNLRPEFLVETEYPAISADKRIFGQTKLIQ